MHFQVYGKDNCAYCFRAVALLTSHNLAFKEFKLGREFTREELLEIFPSAKTFPQIKMISDNGVETIIGGYEDLLNHFSDS